MVHTYGEASHWARLRRGQGDGLYCHFGMEHPAHYNGLQPGTEEHPTLVVQKSVGKRWRETELAV